MATTDSELREIYASAPVAKDTFEVITLKSSWFEYHLQNAFTEGVEVQLEDDSVVFAEYAPMGLGQASSNADLSYERTIVIQQVNDIIGEELAKRDPESDELPVIQSRGYVMYRDGTVSQLKTPVIETELNKTTRNETGTSFSTSVKPVREQATGEVDTVSRVPMLRAFV